jgi:hypothetical protein
VRGSPLVGRQLRRQEWQRARQLRPRCSLPPSLPPPFYSKNLASVSQGEKFKVCYEFNKFMSNLSWEVWKLILTISKVQNDQALEKRIKSKFLKKKTGTLQNLKYR